MQALKFTAPPISPAADALRVEVREFLRQEFAGPRVRDRSGTLGGFSPEFSRKLGSRSWLGMNWPKLYGGHERSYLERYVVMEEMLAARAPINAHNVADRQSGPLLLRFGSEEQRQTILPRIAAGECYFCIGMSEPDSGSDLASVRTRATQGEDGTWRINGTKVWTSYADRCHYMILFCRTGERSEQDRHVGFSQFLIDMTTPGVHVNPIVDLSGNRNFCEVVFEDACVPDSAIIGKIGNAWHQLTSELALERSGADRFLAAFNLFTTLVRAVAREPSERAVLALGRHAAHVIVLRRMSRSVAGMVQSGEDPALQAAIVKDLGTSIEQELADVARQLIAVEADLDSDEDLAAALAETILSAPSFSIRGGTREILRNGIARGLGLR